MVDKIQVEYRKDELKKQYNIDEMKNIIKFILKNYYDLSRNDQYAIFLELSDIKLNKLDFLEYRKQVQTSLKVKFTDENLKMKYHTEMNMGNTHMTVLYSLKEQFNYYKDRWDQESKKPYPNDLILRLLTQMMGYLSELIGKFNLGTPILVYIQNQMKVISESNRKVSLDKLNELNKYTTLPNFNNNTDESTTSNTEGEGTTEESEQTETGINLRLPESNETEHLQSSVTNRSSKGGSEQSSPESETRTTEALF